MIPYIKSFIKLFYLLIVLLLINLNDSSIANEKLLKFKSINEKSTVANLRSGPGDWYPVKWVIRRPKLPLLVVKVSKNFKYVELHDGTEGWLHKKLISNSATAILVRDSYIKDYQGNRIAKILKNSIVKVNNCFKAKIDNIYFCNVYEDNFKGYLPKNDLWGKTD